MKKAFTGGSNTMKQWSKHFDHMECPGSIQTLIYTRLLTNGLPIAQKTRTSKEILIHKLSTPTRRQSFISEGDHYVTRLED
jgi:hypothetical protein